LLARPAAAKAAAASRVDIAEAFCIILSIP
jgi:hypothetical protein